MINFAATIETFLEEILVSFLGNQTVIYEILEFAIFRY